jgi:hypothetical protein
MLGERLAEAVVNRKLRKILTNERVRAIVSDALSLVNLGGLLPSKEKTDALAARLRYYAGVEDAKPG